MSRRRPVTPETWDAHVAERLAAHEACTDAATRGGIRQKLRETGKRLGVSPPTWCLVSERHQAASARNVSAKQRQFGSPRRRRREASRAPSKGVALATFGPREIARPIDIIPSALREWRVRTCGACVSVDMRGRVVLDEPGLRRVYPSIDDAVRAVA